jgi:hypothetical protein
MKKTTYTTDDIIFKNNRFSTRDGEYLSRTESKGYSYWNDKNETPLACHYGYDYFFVVNNIRAKTDAVNILNKLLS